MAGKPVQPVHEGTVEKLRPFDRFVQSLLSEAEATASFTDNSEITANVIDQMMAANSLDDAMKVQDAGMLSGKDMVDVEHEVTSFDVVKGDAKYEEHSIGVYLRVTGRRLDTDADITYAVGAANVVTLLMVARRSGEIPGEFVIRSKDTANGALLLLRRVPKRSL